MASRRRFELFYRLGFTPWDGHPIHPRLRDLIEGTPTNAPLAPAAALDVGCGTGDTAIYLAQHHWRVTGVDFAAHALRTARRKAATTQAAVTFVHADVTRLTDGATGSQLALIVDTGCLHTLAHDDRRAYVGELTARAAPHALLLILAYPPHTQRGVPGITEQDLTTLLTPDWTLLHPDDPHDASPTKHRCVTISSTDHRAKPIHKPIGCRGFDDPKTGSSVRSTLVWATHIRRDRNGLSR